MKHAHFRFYAELNDFLPADLRGKEIAHAFRFKASVKDMIEGLGVPHTEIDLILANGTSVDFTYAVEDGDRISVYPVFESIDISPIVRVRPNPLREPRFVLDTHLGRLASALRMVGFDALYRNDFRDEVLAQISQEEERILLTRDRGLLKRSRVTHGYWIRGIQVREQLKEVILRFDLERALAPFRRCLRCNGLLQRVPKEAVADRLLPKTKLHFDTFRRCPDCDRVYWRGSHFQRMQRFLDRILQEIRDP
ncbi:MAG: Mut7-C RNAse domain-containing protein [Planctomycetota bacterium]|jgi:uncharacterized protein with PIN domain